MAKASDNRFPKLLLTETAAPTAPAAGDQALFIDPTDHKVKRINSTGAVTTIEGGSSGGSGGGDADWTTPVPLNAWVNFGGTATTLGFRKDSAGVVHVRGRVKSGASGTAVLTFPVGYRPSGVAAMPLSANGFVLAALYVDGATGAATIFHPGGAANQDIGLDGVSFYPG